MFCIFCKIIGREIPGKIVYEDDEVLAFDDIHPQAPVHILIIPKRHIDSIITATDADELLLGKLVNVARRIAQEKNLTGYKLAFNVGKDGGQVVFHIHLHLTGSVATLQ
jgi:histidine triad (HIT) family protein